ncbi:MAG: hypothetical protein OEZ68_01455 [Gammaproteobacteria bacterium]|nr:hypothetical protein [Gammaproteobacteria bacterium]MDH5799445.1 hypothetical protein [Gammaproteobacteria bacterium]
MIQLLFVTPLFIAVIYLITALIYRVDNVFAGTVFFHLPPLLMLFIPAVYVLQRLGMLQLRLPSNLWLYSAFLAPLALLYSWVMAGQPLTAQGYLFFMDWLSRDPNVGPLNFQVLFAISCMLGGAFLPSLFALRALSSIDIRGLLILFFINIVVFIPVFVKMDLLLWYAAFSSHPNTSLSLAYGPLLRTGSLFCCGLFIIGRLK